MQANTTTRNKILLVNPDFTFKNSEAVIRRKQNDFPLNLGLLGSVLIKNGYEVELINSNISPNWQERVIASISDPNLLYIGFTVMSSQVKSAIEIAKRIKAEKDVPIVFGGVHPTLVPESIIRTGIVDFCVVNEGDKAVTEIARYLNGSISIDDIPNIVTKKGDEIIRTAPATPTPFDGLPQEMSPELYEKNLKEYIGDAASNYFAILTGLGCNYNCAFCINDITKRRYRAKSADAIYNEMKYLNTRHNIWHFVFQEEHFFHDRTRLYRLLDLIENDKELYGKIKWHTNVRVTDIKDTYLNAELLKRIKAAGCEGLGTGGESGSVRVLKELRKGTTPEDIRRAARYCNDAGISLRFSFVMLWPTETTEEMIETAQLIRELLEIGECIEVPYFQTYRPYPGSKWEPDLSKFENPEAIPEDLWRMQLVTEDRLTQFKDPKLTYNLIMTTQVMCNCARQPPGNILKKIAAKALYKTCSIRIKRADFRLFIEKEALRYVQTHYDAF